MTTSFTTSSAVGGGPSCTDRPPRPWRPNRPVPRAPTVRGSERCRCSGRLAWRPRRSGGSGGLSTDAPSRDQPVLDDPPQGPPDRVRPIARTVAVVAGLVAIVGALVLPFAPVDVSTPEVRWPVDPRDPAPTML